MPRADVLIVGAGPTGMAAACAAAESGRSVLVVDDNPTWGGQIWRGAAAGQSGPAGKWIDRAQRAGVHRLVASVIGSDAPGRLVADEAGRRVDLRYKRLILASGARERFLPFEGWTLPGVCGAGGLQALVKTGYSVVGRRVVVAGSGPLLLAVAALLRQAGATVLLVAEQAPTARLAAFATYLLTRFPGKLAQAAELRWRLRGATYRGGCWPVAAEGTDHVSAVQLTDGRRTWMVPCDALACGFGLVPNLELAWLLGCRIRGVAGEGSAVEVDRWQQSSVPQILAAGEACGIGGVETSLVEGQIAGYVAADRQPQAESLFPTRRRARQFADRLASTFALRDELRQLPRAQTIVCRCEDVRWQAVQVQSDWTSAKLQTRCGMGPCQGRVCGAALEFLKGFGPRGVRPPLFPVPLAALALPEHLEAADAEITEQNRVVP